MDNLKIIIGLLPEYFFEVAASASGKHHPGYALGKGGLLRHSKAVMRIARELLDNPVIGNNYKPIEKDLMLIACLLHDSVKRADGEKHTRFDHPLLAVNLLYKNKDKLSLDGSELKFLAHVIRSHMGVCNTSVKSDTVLPVPSDKYQIFVHMCDYLA